MDDVPDFPPAIAKTDDVVPVPRRIRGYLAGQLVLDTTAALYVWEWPHYPQYYVPVADVLPGALVDEQKAVSNRRGSIRVHGLRVGEVYRAGVAKVLTKSPIDGLTDTVRIDWSGLDSWFEEDEQVFVHPRSPYVRVDALRSSRVVRVELDGVLLAADEFACLAVRDGVAHPLLPAAHRSAAGKPGAERDRQRMSLQGNDDGVLLGRGAVDPFIRTSRGPTTSRPARCCRSPASWRSTKRRSASAWMEPRCQSRPALGRRASRAAWIAALAPRRVAGGLCQLLRGARSGVALASACATRQKRTKVMNTVQLSPQGGGIVGWNRCGRAPWGGSERPEASPTTEVRRGDASTCPVARTPAGRQVASGLTREPACTACQHPPSARLRLAALGPADERVARCCRGSRFSSVARDWAFVTTWPNRRAESHRPSWSTIWWCCTPPTRPRCTCRSRHARPISEPNN